MSTTTEAPDMLRALALAAPLPAPPTPSELESLRINAEAARTEKREAADRVARLQAEIDGAKAALQPRPDLAQVVAALTAQEIEARVKAVPLPKGHAERMAEARSAIAAAEAKRTEAELTVPALESMQGEIRAEAQRTRDAATRAEAAYGSAMMLRELHDRFMPRLAGLLESESTIAAIAEQWGGRYYAETAFTSPTSGDKWTLRDLNRLAEQEAAR